MKKPIAAPAAADLEAPSMPIPPHGGSWIFDEATNELTRAPLPAPDVTEAIAGAVESPVKPDVKEPL